MTPHASQPQLLKTSEAVYATTRSYWTFRRLVNKGVLPPPVQGCHPHAPMWEPDGLLKAWHDYQRQMAK